MIKLKAANNKPFKKIWIKWEDSSSYAARWHFLDDVNEKLENCTCICESTGYLIYEDKEKLAMCDSLAHGDHGEILSIHSLHIVPVCCIIDWKYL